MYENCSTSCVIGILYWDNQGKGNHTLTRWISLIMLECISCDRNKRGGIEIAWSCYRAFVIKRMNETI